MKNTTQKATQKSKIAKSPFAANFTVKLTSVNNKLTCTLSCGGDGDPTCHAPDQEA